MNTEFLELTDETFRKLIKRKESKTEDSVEAEILSALNKLKQTEMAEHEMLSSVFLMFERELTAQLAFSLIQHQQRVRVLWLHLLRAFTS